MDKWSSDIYGISSSTHLIINGQLNRIEPNSDFNTIGTGNFNIIKGSHNQIHNGDNNCTITQHSAIFNGNFNVINNPNATSNYIFNGNANSIQSCNSLILNGTSNNIQNGSFNSIINGNGHNIFEETTAGVIGSGENNCLSFITNSSNPLILAGTGNLVSSSDSVIAGGFINTIHPESNCSFIGGGEHNTLNLPSSMSSIGGGLDNSIFPTINSAIIGGRGNESAGVLSVIGGGDSNSIVNVSLNSILGGRNNRMFDRVFESYIAGGEQNSISFAGNTGDVWVNSIYGGEDNIIDGGTCNTILGGRNNTINGNFNAILGGSDNVINGFNYVGLFGHGITAVRDEAFHANNYLINNMPPGFGVPGLLWRVIGTNEVNIS